MLYEVGGEFLPDPHSNKICGDRRRVLIRNLLPKILNKIYLEIGGEAPHPNPLNKYLN